MIAYKTYISKLLTYHIQVVFFLPSSMGSSSSSVTDVEFVEGQVEGPEMEYEKCHNISNIHYCMPDALKSLCYQCLKIYLPRQIFGVPMIHIAPHAKPGHSDDCPIGHTEINNNF